MNILHAYTRNRSADGKQKCYNNEVLMTCKPLIFTLLINIPFRESSCMQYVLPVRTIRAWIREMVTLWIGLSEEIVKSTWFEPRPITVTGRCKLQSHQLTNTNNDNNKPLWILYRPTSVSQNLQLRTGGYCLYAMLTATSAFELGKRHRSSHQQCYVHCLCIFLSLNQYK